MKSYTNIEQSKKLAEILPIESADMGYLWNGTSFCDYPVSNQTIFKRVENIPCWSLAALLNVLPQSITKYIEGESCQKTFHLNLFRSHYYCCSYSFSPSISDDDGNNTLYCVGKYNWVDACVAMVEKLKELNLL